MKTEKIKKVLILGGDNLTLKILDYLKNNFEYKILSSKRNLNNKINNIKFEDYLLKYKANYKLVSSISSSIEFNKQYNSKNAIYLCMSSPWILKKKDLKKIRPIILNSHGTRLPQYRGGASFSWLAMNRVRFGFNNLYIIDDKIDSGKIIDYDEFLYPHHLRTPAEYFEFYMKRQVSFIIEQLEKFKKIKRIIDPIKQQEYLSSYYPRLNHNIHGWIDWSLNFLDLNNFVNSFGNPLPGCATYYNKNKVFIKRSSLNYEDPIINSYKSGMIYRKGKGWICVSANGGSLIIEEVIYKNKNIIDSMKIGNRFYTPQKKVEQKSIRVFYDHKGLKKNFK